MSDSFAVSDFDCSCLIMTAISIYSMTYSPLNERANLLAHLLIEKGVREEVVVPYSNWYINGVTTRNCMPIFHEASSHQSISTQST
jgi:hypothetical protein